MEYDRRIKILAEGMRTYEASFNREVTEEDVANRIKLDGYIYDVKELREKYVCKEYLIYKFNAIIKCAKYLQILLDFVSESLIAKNTATEIADENERQNFLAVHIVDFFYSHPTIFDDYIQEFMGEEFRTVFFGTFSRYDMEKLIQRPEFMYYREQNEEGIAHLKQIYKTESFTGMETFGSLLYSLFKKRDVNFFLDKTMSDIIFHAKREIAKFCTTKLFLNNEDKRCIFVIPVEYYAKLNYMYDGFTEDEKSFYAVRELSPEKSIEFYKNFAGQMETVRADAETELSDMDYFTDNIRLLDFVRNNKKRNPNTSEKVDNLRMYLENPIICEKLYEFLAYHSYDWQKGFQKDVMIADFASYIVAMSERYDGAFTRDTRNGKDGGRKREFIIAELMTAIQFKPNLNTYETLKRSIYRFRNNNNLKEALKKLLDM